MPLKFRRALDEARAGIRRYAEKMPSSHFDNSIEQAVEAMAVIHSEELEVLGREISELQDIAPKEQMNVARTDGVTAIPLRLGSSYYAAVHRISVHEGKAFNLLGTFIRCPGETECLDMCIKINSGELNPPISRDVVPLI